MTEAAPEHTSSLKKSSQTHPFPAHSWAHNKAKPVGAAGHKARPTQATPASQVINLGGKFLSLFSWEAFPSCGSLLVCGFG